MKYGPGPSSPSIPPLLNQILNSQRQEIPFLSIFLERGQRSTLYSPHYGRGQVREERLGLITVRNGSILKRQLSSGVSVSSIYLVAVRNFPCQTLKISKVSVVVMGL
jgi:hypothetical protein